METLANREVDVTAFYFNKQTKSCFPKRVEMNGQPIAMLETGLRLLVSSGQKIAEVFNMTDGYAQYDLRYEPDTRTWTLLNTHPL